MLEYKTKRFVPDFNENNGEPAGDPPFAKEIENFLNAQAAEGWRLVSVVPLDQPHGYGQLDIMVTLERIKPDPPKVDVHNPTPITYSGQ